MAKTSKEKQRKDNMSSSSSVTSIEDQPIKKTKRTRKCVPRDSPQKRSSVYRGVTRHRWTGRYEAHLWDKTCWNESQKKKGRQVYLGAYDDELAAAHAYDLAALKYWGQDTIINFPLSTYQKELEEMEVLSKEEYIGSLRRKSSGFSRGVSKYRGVARHHHNGRWEARIGRVFGNKYLYLGTYATQEAAATAYDIAAIEYRGINAVTNFEISRYIKWLKPNQAKNIVDINIDINPQQTNSSNFVEMDHFTPNPTEEFESVFRQHHQHQYPQQSAGSIESSAPPPPPPPGNGGGGSNASTALGLLLQSTKFKEMLELTSEGGVECPLAIPEPIVTRRSFPDDIQTYFDCNHVANFTDEHEGIFGDFASVMFSNELDT